MFELKGRNFSIRVVTVALKITNLADEARNAAGIRVACQEAINLRARIERLSLNFDHAYPPVTGGKKAISEAFSIRVSKET